MNNKRQVFSISLKLIMCCSITFFYQCKNIQLAEFHPSPELKSKLPALQNINSTTAPLVFGSNIYQDAVSLYNRNLEDNLTDPVGEKYGYVLYKTFVAQNTYKGWGLYTGSIITLGIPNLLGLPLLMGVTHLEVEIDFMNSKKELIAKYKGEGYSKIPVALYYGYGLSSALRESNLRALKLALKSINTQVEKDVTLLRQKLIEAGPITK